jgi:hypothetical protein
MAAIPIRASFVLSLLWHEQGRLKISVSIKERVATLRLRHKELDQIIEEEQQRPRPDDPLIKNLKRQKLRIKDKIAGLEIGSMRPLNLPS